MPAKPGRPVRSADKVKRGSDKPAGSTLRSGLRQFTQQRLLDAALECFRERGYRETTIENIVELAGTTVTTFYRYFPGKIDLLKHLLDHLITEVEATLRELDTLDVARRKEVRRWLDSYMVMWGRVHRLCTAHWEAVTFDEAYAKRVMDDALSCSSVMQQTLERLEPEARERTSLRMGLIIVFIDRMALVVSVERSAVRARAIMDEFAGILWLILNDSPALNNSDREGD